jgi:hypothetical protein
MTTTDDLKAHAERINATVNCESDTCDFDEWFSDYLDRADRVDTDAGTVEWRCPDCDHDTLLLGRADISTVYAVHGLAELEALTDG